MKELKMFIDGRFIENESGKWIKVLNPSTEEAPPSSTGINSLSLNSIV